ncbi:MAG: hypothetical protein AAF645_29680 [Myxococcota bacterium]
MGYEKTDPQNKVIFITAVGSALTLIGLIPVFHTYFDSRFIGELEDKVYTVTSSEYESIAESRAQVESAPVSIQAAAERLATGNRRGTPVAPRRTDTLDVPETDAEASLGAVKGWSARERIREEAHARDAMMRSRAREQARRDARAAAEAAAAEGTETP